MAAICVNAMSEQVLTSNDKFIDFRVDCCMHLSADKNKNNLFLETMRGKHDCKVFIFLILHASGKFT